MVTSVSEGVLVSFTFSLMALGRSFLIKFAVLQYFLEFSLTRREKFTRC